MSKLNITRSKILTLVYHHFQVPKKYLKDLTTRGIAWHAGEMLFTVPIEEASGGVHSVNLVFGETNIQESILTLDIKVLKKKRAYSEYMQCMQLPTAMEAYCLLASGSRDVHVITDFYELTGYSGPGGIYFEDGGVTVTTLKNYLTDRYPIASERE